MFEHQKLKAKQLFYNVSSELYQISQTKTVRTLFEQTLHCLIDWLVKILQTRFKFTRFKAYGLLDELIVVSTYILQEIFQ